MSTLSERLGSAAFPMELILFKLAISGFRWETDPSGSWSSFMGDSGGQVSTVR